MKKNNKILVSVIVPVYNVQDYIEKCLDSLINQTLEQLEVIVIDDGSTDKTGLIVDEYQNKYKSKIKVIHKKNEGVSIARNVGLEKATGEYIGFLDSDDWVNYDMYEKLYKLAIKDNCDIVACDTLAIYPDKKVLIESHINETSTTEDLMLNAYAVIWNKIYKREIIDRIKFKEKMNFCEDVQFLYMVYPKIKKIGVIHETLHNYLQRVGSLTYTYNEKLYQLIDSLDDIVNYYKEQGFYQKYYAELEYSYVRYLYATFIKRLAKTKNKVEFDRGVNFVLDKVNNNFPNYKKNKYIKKINGKSLYLKYFNKFLAKMVFNFEKNRLN
ncbi:MAG: glycosyltransferase [Bacilli bacterium]|nr:glycosyltransferase [Bacilli bacterium]